VGFCSVVNCIQEIVATENLYVLFVGYSSKLEPRNFCQVTSGTPNEYSRRGKINGTKVYLQELLRFFMKIINGC
jgi:hypothetical protein